MTTLVAVFSCELRTGTRPQIAYHARRMNGNLGCCGARDYEVGKLAKKASPQPLSCAAVRSMRTGNKERAFTTR